MRAYSCPSEHVVNNRGHGKQCTANAKCGTLTFNLCSVCHSDKLVGVFLILELEIKPTADHGKSVTLQVLWEKGVVPGVEIDTWYQGLVTSYNPTSKLHGIRYDDGDFEEEDLTSTSPTKFELVD
jgi:hypothetical protein